MLKTLKDIYHRWLGVSEEPSPLFADEFKSLSASLEHRVPRAALTKLDAVQSLLIRISRRLEDRDDLVYVRHIVNQTVYRYLPDIVADYLKIPVDLAWTRKHPLTQSTALESLLAQFDLLILELRSNLEKLEANQSRELFVHHIFLKDKFDVKDS